MKNLAMEKKQERNKEYKNPYSWPNIDPFEGDIYSLPTRGKNKNLVEIKKMKGHEHCSFVIVGNKVPHATISEAGNDRAQRGYLINGKRREQSSARPTNVKCINSKDPNRIGKTLKENIDTYNELVKKNKEAADKKKELDNRLEGFRKSAKEKSTLDAYKTTTFTQMKLFEQPEELPDFRRTNTKLDTPGILLTPEIKTFCDKIYKALVKKATTPETAVWKKYLITVVFGANKVPENKQDSWNAALEHVTTTYGVHCYTDTTKFNSKGTRYWVEEEVV